MTSFLLSLTELGFVTEARGFSIEEKANLFTIKYVADIVMKLVQGMIADLQVIRKTFKYPMKFLYRFNAVGMAVTMIAACLVDSFPGLATVAAIATFFNANVMINYSQILRCGIFFFIINHHKVSRIFYISGSFSLKVSPLLWVFRAWQVL